MNLEDQELNFSAICRICLKSNKTLFNIFQTEALDMLGFCGFLKVKVVAGDELPDKICESCNNMLLQSYKLKQLCEYSETYLQSLVLNKNNLKISSKNDNFKLNLGCLQLPKELSEQKPVKNIALHTCSECQTSFYSEKLFNEHSCNISVDDDDSVFPSSGSVTNNQVLPTENEPDSICEEVDEKINVTYICPKCNVRFDHKQDFSVHQSVHSENDPMCNVCNKIFRTMRMLRRHVKTHMISKSHVCKICDKGFCESPALIKHMKQNHLRLPREKKYACDECGQRFTDKYYLNLHNRKHTGEKPFECTVCNKAFYDPRSYKIHMDVHKGTKPYLCSHCGKSFVQSSHLRQHLLVHTKQKPYSCNVCNKRFTQSTSLQRHQKVQMGKFYCCICLKSFQTKEEFLDHKEDHFH